MPQTLLRIRPEIFNSEPGLGLKLGQTKPQISGTVPTNRHTAIPNVSGPTSACFDDDPKLLNCKIAQPSSGRVPVFSGRIAKTPCMHKSFTPIRAQDMPINPKHTNEKKNQPPQQNKNTAATSAQNHHEGVGRCIDEPRLI